MALLCGCQRIGARGSAGCCRLFAACDRWQNERQLAGAQVAHHAHAVKTTIAQQAFDANAPGAQTCKAGSEHLVHALIGPHAIHGQGGTTAPAPGIGRSIGAEVRRATCSWTTADLVLIGLIHGAGIGQGDHIKGHPASTCTQALARSSWSQAWCTESLEVAANTNTLSRSRLCVAPGIFKGKVASVLMVKVYTSWLCKVY